MSGLLGIGTSWTRRLFPGDTRAEAEALIPDGYQVNVVPVNGKPGPWRVTGLRQVPYPEHPVELLAWTTYSPQDAVRRMAEELGGIAARIESWTLAADMTASVRVDYMEDVA